MKRLASIPLLELSDLNPNMEAVERRESKIGNTTVHFVPTFTKGINYVGLYFKLRLPHRRGVILR